MQLAGLLLGARIFLLLFYGVTLYVSTFFLFNQEESLRNFVFDYKVHGIILCSLLSIAAGSIINQFYDLDKDKIQKPFRTRLQSFLQQKYFLYTYLLLNLVSLSIAAALSVRILIFFLIYQFLMWFYSHKLSKILVLNNMFYVALSLYPFFGLLVYYQHFSRQLLFMAVFLFLLVLAIDVLKDLLTLNTDKLFDYNTLPIVIGSKGSLIFVCLILITDALVAWLIPAYSANKDLLSVYYILSCIVLSSVSLLIFFKTKIKISIIRNVLRMWIFVGVIFMLINGFLQKF